MRYNQSSRRAASNSARGRITAVNDEKGVQRLDVKVLSGEVHTNVERFQQAGLTTHPPPGTEVAISYMGGNRSHPVVVATENKKYRRRSLKPGGAALHDLAGKGVEITAEPDGLKVDSNGQPLKIRFNDGTTMEYSADGVKLKRGDAEVSLTDAAALLKKGLLVSVTPQRVDLGGPGGTRVATEAGYSNKVFAIL